MIGRILFGIFLLFVVTNRINGRAYHLDDSIDVVRSNDGIYYYPVIGNRRDDEQASRDLDLSFSAGDPVVEDLVRPIEMVYNFVPSEKSYVKTNKVFFDRAKINYKIPDVLKSKKSDYLDEDEIDGNRKLVRLNNGANRGEIILDLRVIANHDTR